MKHTFLFLIIAALVTPGVAVSQGVLNSKVSPSAGATERPINIIMKRLAQIVNGTSAIQLSAKDEYGPCVIGILEVRKQGYDNVVESNKNGDFEDKRVNAPPGRSYFSAIGVVTCDTESQIKKYSELRSIAASVAGQSPMQLFVAGRFIGEGRAIRLTDRKSDAVNGISMAFYARASESFPTNSDISSISVTPQATLSLRADKVVVPREIKRLEFDLGLAELDLCGFKPKVRIKSSLDLMIVATEKCAAEPKSGDNSTSVVVNSTELPMKGIDYLGIIFSPNSKRFAFGIKSSNGWALVDSGKSVIEGLESLFDMVFSPDSSELAVIAKNPAGVVVLKGRSVTQTNYETAGNIEFSPDGRRFAFTGQRNQSSYAVVDGVEIGPFSSVSRVKFSADSKRYLFAAELQIGVTNAIEIRNSVPVAPGKPQKFTGLVADGQLQPYAFGKLLSATFSPGSNSVIALGSGFYRIALDPREPDIEAILSKLNLEFLRLDSIGNETILTTEGVELNVAKRKLVAGPWFSSRLPGPIYIVESDGAQQLIGAYDIPIECSRLSRVSVNQSDGRIGVICTESTGDRVLLDRLPLGRRYDASSSIVFDSATSSVAWISQDGEKEKILLDGKEVAEFDTVIGNVVFDGRRRLVALGLRNGHIYRSVITWQ